MSRSSKSSLPFMFSYEKCCMIFSSLPRMLNPPSISPLWFDWPNFR
jgi:hypothetical protein